MQVAPAEVGQIFQNTYQPQGNNFMIGIVYGFPNKLKDKRRKLNFAAN